MEEETFTAEALEEAEGLNRNNITNTITMTIEVIAALLEPVRPQVSASGTINQVKTSTISTITTTRDWEMVITNTDNQTPLKKASSRQPQHHTLLRMNARPTMIRRAIPCKRVWRLPGHKQNQMTRKELVRTPKDQTTLTLHRSYMQLQTAFNKPYPPEH